MNPTSSKTEQRALHLALDLAESAEARMSGFALADHFGKHGQFLISMGLLVPAGQVGAIAADDDLPVGVEWSARNQSYGFFSEADGWVALQNEHVMMYALQFEALISLLTEQMDLHPRTICLELVPTLLWELAPCRLPGVTKRVSVWVARRLNDPEVWEQFDRMRRDRPATEVRMVLHLAAREDNSLPFVPNHCIIAVGSVMSAADPLQIAPQIAAARLRGQPGADGRLTVSADGGYVQVGGKEYKFRGGKQRAIVRLLYEAWERGKPRCLTEQVLLEAGSSDSTRRLSRAFKGHPNSHEIIKERDGFCWLEA